MASRARHANPSPDVVVVVVLLLVVVVVLLLLVLTAASLPPFFGSCGIADLLLTAEANAERARPIKQADGLGM